MEWGSAKEEEECCVVKEEKVDEPGLGDTEVVRNGGQVELIEIDSDAESDLDSDGGETIVLSE